MRKVIDKLRRVIDELERAGNRLKPFVEIGAIVIAGWWTYSIFIRTEAPALKENFKFESSLTWHRLKDNSSCVAEGIFKVTNQSKSTVEVRKTRRRAWFVDIPRAGPGISHFDPMEKALTTQPLDEHWYEGGGPFVQTYAPAASSDYAFEWFVENRPNTYALFRLDLYADQEAEQLLDFKYDWGLPCDFETAATPVER
jgi:hypothetical protein